MKKLSIKFSEINRTMPYTLMLRDLSTKMEFSNGLGICFVVRLDNHLGHLLTRLQDNKAK